MLTELDQLVQFLDQAYGKDISYLAESFVAKTLEKKLALIMVHSIPEYLEYLAENPVAREDFFQSLNITYSEFFRNPLTDALLENFILPKLIEEKSERAEIRVWSAGCAAGQETYSIAILMDELINLREKPSRFRIFATDQSEDELALARQGVYDYAAVQNVRFKHLHRYFTQVGETYVVSAKLRDYIDFSYHDLIDQHSASPSASIYGDFDLVMCSNLLFYYKPQVQQFILNQVYRSLSPTGYLVTGEAERTMVENTTLFRLVAPPAAVFQKR